MSKLDFQGLKHLFVELSIVMNKEKDNLCNLDAKIGDGDLGITMSTGFSKVAEMIVQIDEEDVGKVLQYVGSIFAQYAPSTMGTLMASGFIEAGKALKGSTQIDEQGIFIFIGSFKEGLTKRGKAKPGDKTVVDVLDHCLRAIEEVRGKSLIQVVEAAKIGAYEGLEATKKMMSIHGKAAVFREKTLGKQDPGATVFFLFISAIADYMHKNDNPCIC